mgnify:FL=1
MNMEECQEVGCKEKAIKEWNGKKVCSDHYDMYREQHEKLSRDNY